MFVADNFLWSEKILNRTREICYYRIELSKYPAHTTANPRNPLVDKLTEEDRSRRRRLWELCSNTERDLSALIDQRAYKTGGIPPWSK